MEELRSTEALSREILEDARKKADKILKTAKLNLDVQGREWNEKLSSALDSIRKSYEEKTKKSEEEIFARLPLDKRRLRSEAADKQLLGAMDDFLSSISREKLLSILERELAECLQSEEAHIEKAEVCYSNLSLPELKSLLKRVSLMPDYKAKEADDHESHGFPSITINTQSMKISSSVESAAAALLKSKRAEMACALLGEGVLND